MMVVPIVIVFATLIVLLWYFEEKARKDLADLPCKICGNKPSAIVTFVVCENKIVRCKPVCYKCLAEYTDSKEHGK